MATGWTLVVILVACKGLLTKGDYEYETRLLNRAVGGLARGLDSMEENHRVINVDGILGCRLVEEQLYAFLYAKQDVVAAMGKEFYQKLKKLQKQAYKIAETATPYVKKTEPEYYDIVGNFVEEAKNIVWHPMRDTNPMLREVPDPCSKSHFNESFSDGCYEQIVGSKTVPRCNMDKSCIDFQMAPKRRGYILTHQVLYFYELERSGCLKDVKELNQQALDAIMDRLCTNVLKEAEEIADAGFPLDHRDLFMEQIGLCGIEGYSEFYKPEWVETILDWQEPSGCFTGRHKWKCAELNEVRDLKSSKPEKATFKRRFKREEKTLDDGCLSHKTAVALIALEKSIEFAAQKLASMDNTDN